MTGDGVSFHLPDSPSARSSLRLEHHDALSMFRATAARHSNRPMLKYFNSVLSFAQVNEESDAFAAGMLHQGFTNGDRLAIVAHNIPHFIIAMIATWKAGGIVVPISPTLQDQEIVHVILDSGAAYIACEEARLGDWINRVPLRARVVALCPHDYHTELDSRNMPPHVLPSRGDVVGFEEVLAAHRGEEIPQIVPEPSSGATIIYTSGTTGTPKGALNRHESLAFVSHVYRDWISLTEEDCILEAAPLSTILGIAVGVAPSLLTGCSVSISYRPDVNVLVNTVRAHRATFLMGAPTVFLGMLRDSSIRPEDLTSLKHLYCGAATVPPRLVEQWYRRFGQRLGTAYGMTEASGPTHLSPAGAEVPIDPTSGALSIGVPVFQTNCRIVNPNGSVDEERGEGEIGEMVVSGPQMIFRYWNDSEAAADTIVDGWIRTGDLAVRKGDWLFVIDRIKDIIVTAGNNVSPRQVEECLFTHPDVLEAAVIGLPDEYRGEIVHAIVVKADGSSLCEADLIKHCRSRLANYKVPRTVAFVNSLPLNPGGKVLKRRLREQATGLNPPSP